MSSTDAPVRLVYFAWVRERIGRAEEERALPAGADTPASLMAHLASLGDEYARAFADVDAIRVALDKRVADADQPIGSAREIAFFPPMTGG